MARRKIRLIGPLVLIGLAIVIGSAPQFRPASRVDLGALDLRPGARRAVTVKVPYSEQYDIGVEMDQATVMRLFPCVTDPSKFGPNSGECPNPARLWPLSLSFNLSNDGRDLTKTISASDGNAGGLYVGRETYTWQPAFVGLKGGATYTLTVRSLADGSALAPAHPRLVLDVARAGFDETVLLEDLAAELLAAGLLLVAALWAVISWARSRRAKGAAA